MSCMLNRFEKRVRYALRKARADIRRRVKGRFVKAGDAYDYDPLSHISCWAQQYFAYYMKNDNKGIKAMWLVNEYS